MYRSPDFATLRAPGPPRRLILCAAVALALAVWCASKMPAASAQEPKAPAAPALPALPTLPTLPALPALPALPSAAAGKASPAPGDRNTSVEISVDARTDHGADKAEADDADAAKAPGAHERSVTIRKGGKSVTVTRIPGDREFDSFDEMVHMEPALAVMIVAIVAVIFFAPVAAIALIIFYRMRKARMQNETMLKLAERGIVAPPEALAAIAGNPSPAAMAAGASGGTGIDLRKRAAWSDLRKGVVMTGIGLAFSIYSLLDDRTPNFVGLILLFVGIGYILLWWFEQRQIGAGHGGVPGAGAQNLGGPGPGSATGVGPGDAGGAG